jgi:uncharacterized repeat protein (TIGR03987 family)
MLVKAITWMSCALIFYTWAVFSGRKEGLRRKHLIIFGMGLMCDFLGTMQMNIFAHAYGKAPVWHDIVGKASLAGMAFHFLLALTATVTKRGAAANHIFHRVSVTIYTCWLIAFLSGAVSGMIKMHK